MSPHVSIHRATCTWAIVLGLVVLVMVRPECATRRYPCHLGATSGPDPGSPAAGGLRDELGKKGVVLDVDLPLQTLQGVASGGRNEVATYWGLAEYTLNVDTQKPASGRAVSCAFRA